MYLNNNTLSITTGVVHIMKKLNEINMIRAIMCILVVVTHSLTKYVINVDLNPVGEAEYVQMLRLALLCATPIFILLSETLIAKNYASGTPKGFFTKRIKFILVPYILVGVVLSYIRSDNTLESFLANAQQIVLYGQWHGFFILVIFQFYVLHWLLGRFMAKLNPILPLLITFVISFLHSYGYFHVDQYREFTNMNYPLWFRTHILFWLFYFTAGFYIGQYYETIISFLIKRLWIPVLTTILAFGSVLYVYQGMGFARAASERYDIMLYAVSVFLLLIAVFRKYNFYNETLMLISNFSFFIYLSHLIILPYFVKLTLDFGENIIVFNVVLTFLTIASSVGGAFLFYQNRLTRLFTGRINYLEKPRQAKEKQTANDPSYSLR